MSRCSKCGAVSQGAVTFCTQCGNAIQPPTNASFTGRPVISMDPHKQGHVLENPGGPAASVQQHASSPQQISNIQPSQFQSSPIPPQVTSSSSNKNKIAIGAVGIIAAIVAIVFLLGRNDSESPSVSPSNQQSGSSSGQTSDEVVDETVPTATMPDDFMVCSPGLCGDGLNIDGNYLELVKRNLPPLYVGKLSDSQLFEMAEIWCNALHEGEWTKIKDLIAGAYDKGVPNDYNLYVFTLGGATLYCMTYQPEVLEYIGSLQEL